MSGRLFVKRPVRGTTTMSSSSPDCGGSAMKPLRVSVVDVYEIATDMGKELERMMDAHGADAVTQLMPKVINALEMLEAFAAINEEEASQMDDLRARVGQLEREKIGKAEDRLKYEQELEQIEENLREENRDLMALVARVQDENRKLNHSLAAEKEGSASDLGCNHETDLVILQKMNVVLEKHREQLRLKERELQLKAVELETAQTQLERFSHSNQELHRKQRNSQLQTRALIEEKAELQMQLQDQQRELQALSDNLGATRKTNEDLLRMKSPTMPNLSNKVVYDLDDPDRPRFTMNELRKILFERNELKAKVSELQDELDQMRPKKVSPTEEEEAPVQGPINREPDDAPWKKHDSGIRKLFRALFGESSESSKAPSFKTSSSMSKLTSCPEPRAVLH